MRKVMLGAILVWCLCAVEATYNENTDYWYSNDDGMILDSLTPVSLYRSRNENVTSILRSHDDVASKKIIKSKPSWFFKFEKIYPERNKTYLRTFTPPPFKKDPVLERLEKKRTSEETWSCSDGPSKKLDCNHCICIGGQLYLCTAKRCLHPDATGIQVLKSYRERQQDDCIEGEHIKSFDCNKCWCSGGKIICTKKECNRRSLSDARCVPGEPLLSPDKCNTCGCTKHGEKYCTAVACGIKPKEIKDRDVGCVPQTWFSLYGSTTCKECYCTDGKMAFCYLKLCAVDHIQHRGYKPIKMMSAMKPNTCNKGAVMFDECSKCICTYKEQWKCFTRLINKCSGAETENNKQNPRPDKEKGNQGYNEESKPKKPKTKEEKKKKESDDLLDENWKDPNNLDETTTGTETSSPFYPGDGKQPGKNYGNEPQLDNIDDGIPGITEQTIHPSVDDLIEVDMSTKRPKKHTKIPKNSKGKKKPKQQKKTKKTTTQEYIHESIDVDDIATRRQRFRLPRLPIRPKKPKQPKKTQRTKKTTKRPAKTTRGDDINIDVDINAELPRTCDVGELFTQGYASNCQGCFCTAEGKWNCFSVAGPCRGNEWKSCWVGVYEKNTQIPCSVCYCGANGKFMCAVDEHCAQKLKASSCDSIDCEETCQLKKHRDGFCHRDKCTCV